MKTKKCFEIVWQKPLCAFVVSLFVFIVHETALAQKAGYEIRNANMSKKIALTDILGRWNAVDHPESKIEFITNGAAGVNIEGIQHGVGGYYFLADQDSMSVNGSAANWPPFDCTLTLINKNELKIEFYQFHTTEATEALFRRTL